MIVEDARSTDYRLRLQRIRDELDAHRDDGTATDG
jgi:hypothetical protein